MFFLLAAKASSAPSNKDSSRGFVGDDCFLSSLMVDGTAALLGEIHDQMKQLRLIEMSKRSNNLVATIMVDAKDLRGCSSAASRSRLMMTCGLKDLDIAKRVRELTGFFNGTLLRSDTLESTNHRPV